MSVTNPLNKKTYTMDGVTSVFPYDFKIFADSEMTATVTDKVTGAITAELVLGVDFSVSGAGSPTFGDVTILTGLYDNTKDLVLLRVVPATQELIFIDNEATPKSTWAEGYDRAVMLAQQLQEEVDRSIKVNIGATVTPELPAPVDGNVIVWEGVDGTMVNAPYDASELDAAVSAAEASATSASNSASAASSAQTNAETAETNAETAEDGAVAAAASIDQTKIVSGDTEVSTNETADTIEMTAGGTKEAQVDANGLTLKTGASVNKISTDGTLAGDSDDTIITEKAAKAAIDDSARVEVFTAGGTWTCPAGVYLIYVTMIGAGGGGAGYNNGGNSGGGAGGCGALGLRVPMSVVPGQTYNVTVGTGGAGAAANGTGGTGGTTSFAAEDQTVTMAGGIGAASNAGGAAGNSAHSAHTGWDGVNNSKGTEGILDAGHFYDMGAGGNGQGFTNGYGGGSGGSIFGDGQTGSSGGAVGKDGVTFGEGGGGGSHTTAGGDGSDGVVIVYY